MTVILASVTTMQCVRRLLKKEFLLDGGFIDTLVISLSSFELSIRIFVFFSCLLWLSNVLLINIMV